MTIISLRPRCRVAVVSAVVDRVYLRELRHSITPKGQELKVYVSRLYDLQSAECRVSFAETMLDVLTGLLHEKQSGELH
jgi:hypothetical protein